MEISVRFFVGQLVFAKIKGYPPWPGFISEIDGNRAKVTYFNWQNQFNWIGFKKLLPAHAANEIVERYYTKNVSFRGAVNEMQRLAEFVSNERLKKPIDAPQIQNPVQVVNNIFFLFVMMCCFAVFAVLFILFN